MKLRDAGMLLWSCAKVGEKEDDRRCGGGLFVSGSLFFSTGLLRYQGVRVVVGEGVVKSIKGTPCSLSLCRQFSSPPAAPLLF